MGALNFDLSSLSPRTIGIIIFGVILMVAFVAFPYFSGALQVFTLGAKHTGSCVIVSAGEHRFDRVIPMADSVTGAGFEGSAGEYTDANKYDWSNAAALTVTQTSGANTCQFGTTSTASAQKWLTADGKIISLTFAGTDGIAPVSAVKWKDGESLWADNTTLTNVIIGAIILIVGVTPLGVLSGIGIKLISMFGSGISGIARILLGVLGAIIIVTLMNIFVGFISLAYDAVDVARFTMYDDPIAGLAVTIKQFWGLIFLAGFIGIATLLGFQHIPMLKNRGGGGGMRRDSMMG